MIDDPIGLSIVQKQLDHIARQMGWVMMRTARSTIFSQSHDFSCFICDAHGNIVSQADGLPIHTGGGGFAVRAVLERFGREIADGDVFILNDPYLAGGNHLPDYTIIRPVFLLGELLAFCCNRAHQSDIGGGAAGTYNSAATEIFHEGIRLPVLQLIAAGKLRRDLWELLLANTRCPDLLDGDLRAMIGSTEIGARRLAEALSLLRQGTARDYLNGILDYAEHLVREEITRLPCGVYEGEDESDNDCFGPADIRVRVRVTVSDKDLHLDFTGSSPQISGFKNSSIANTYSSVYLAIIAFLGPQLPKNQGAFRAVTVHAPEGTVVNARSPAPMTMNTIFPATNIVHACWKALASCDPKRACAGWGKLLHCVTSGRRLSGETFVLYHGHGLPSAGAVRGRDGFPGMGLVPTLCGSRLANVETQEQFYPITIHKHEMRCDGEGAGEFRGGPGMNYVADVEVAAEYSFRGEGGYGLTAFGVNGGSAGQSGSMTLAAANGEPFDIPQYGVRNLPPLRINITSPGGGGYGDPRRRNPDAVLCDVQGGIVSPRRARDVYGVVLTTDRRSVDADATALLRSRRQTASEALRA
ncbi:hydantoinase B/oxoprolinase family protein [Bradyrhizobium sp. 4]|uniref:hydantoinase B/oxoprolinase family protein n=1 Tax=unclassified Bradyrhizobium TaxID=2631580 RepID=UPI001FFC1D71|nr:MULTISPECIES: hydantoinase B/oxoprolinase family protein [unclassified Bradyrhizobium]MCK1397037.1 hydantoinase B/oxoprolinase family protein [Bradyrhizobium sp. 39]MCK1634666.1 hydantoinase B/oxoprolinase family protein [Bradyrhizobium sp. 162]MCK1749244.1 hydantoinase B/oxoprolinase family protein [Bradyrhizobium sp. 135]UPJ36346.1 hydantoinase B/oxoprolinase family protein [Bradyrhizobium sp. 4]